MIKLVNGRGQLGEALKTLEHTVIADTIIYHTWRYDDKSEPVQREEFEKYQSFLQQWDKETPLAFISTKATTQSAYKEMKTMAEALTSHYANAKIIRIPTLIGRGICQRFYDNMAVPYGQMELATIEKVAYDIIDNLHSRDKIVEIEGKRVDAGLARDLIVYGRDNGKKLAI